MKNGLRLSQAEFDAIQKRAPGAKAPATSKQKTQALGRLPQGTMNKTEARFAEVLERRKLAGEVAWYCFEKVKLMLAPNTSLTVDFFLMLTTGELQAIDVKGARAMVEDDSKAKMKIAAAMFPWPFFYAYPKKPVEAGFDIEQV